MSWLEQLAKIEVIERYIGLIVLGVFLLLSLIGYLSVAIINARNEKLVKKNKSKNR